MDAPFDWPEFTEPKLRARLALGQREFEEFARRLAVLVKPRAYTPADLTNALEYPWRRPRGSFLLEGETVTALDRLPADALDAQRRYPLLAYGSNASPEALANKFSALASEQRSVYALLGRLRDFDVGASAHAAIYGSLPATLVASPGCELNCAVLLVTAEQLQSIAWSEVNYHFGALADAEFATEIDAPPLGPLFAFVSRRGALTRGGKALALNAVETLGRSAPAVSQNELLTYAAQAAIGENATADQLLRELFADFARTSDRVAVALGADAIEFSASGWLRYPAG